MDPYELRFASPNPPWGNLTPAKPQPNPPNELILLGAGASVAAGVPTARDMTVKLLNNLPPTVVELANFIVRRLLSHKVDAGEVDLGSQATIDVEELVNAVLDLRDRDALELAAFVESWDARLARLDFASTRKSAAVDRLVGIIREEINPFLESGETREENVRREEFTEGLHRVVLEVLSGQGRGQRLEELYKLLIKALTSLVSIESSDNTAYLLPLFRPLRSQQSLVIATLNYDNTVELAADTAGIKCLLGLETWNERREFGTPGGGLHLLKLHGSADWSQANENLERFMSENPVLLFGGRNKITAEGPFLDLLIAFGRALEGADRLTAIGYSFRDAHVNEFIGKWRRRHPDREFRVVDPRPDYMWDTHADLPDRWRRQRVFGTVEETTLWKVDLIPMTAEEALPALFGQ